MRNYEIFQCDVKDEIESCLNKNGEDSKVVIRKVLKNNGVELNALTIFSDKSKASPTIYLNSYYEEYQKGRSITDIAEEIYDLIQNNSKEMTMNVDDLWNFDFIKDKIAYKVISATKNEELLSGVPHIKKMDLAIVFYCILKCSDKENITTLIHNQHLEIWDVTEEEVIAVAMENTPKLLPYEIKNMGDIIFELMSEHGCNTEVHEDCNYGGDETDIITNMIREKLSFSDDEKQMYVLTNKYRINGAATMFYPNVLKDFANELESDLVIIPSSVHELILLKKTPETKMDDLEHLIVQVNEDEVDPTEVLSEHAYIYVRETDEIIY